MSESSISRIPDQHRASAPQHARCAVITISDTRTAETDRGGQLIADLLVAAGHVVVSRRIMPDDPIPMRHALSLATAGGEVDAILCTGGTGLSSRDQTFETISQLLTKSLPGFGELFRALSYQEIGAAAMLSRAVGGLIGRVAVFTMPGSPAAVQLAMEKLILPELGHVLREARR